MIQRLYKNLHMSLKIEQVFVLEKFKAENLINWHLVPSTKSKLKIEAPMSWSPQAVELVERLYFRNGETSIRQLVRRVAHTIAEVGLKQKVLTKKSKKIFLEELKYILLTQKGFFNSPVWFNCGLKPDPQVSACFIQSVDDSVDGLFNLMKTEAKLFKEGSGSGTNFSTIRGKNEDVTMGGASSGVISFLEIFDKAAGVIKSGGTTRRAAKMVILNDDHPEILEFIRWKKKEEDKAKALIAQGYDPGFESEAYKTVSGQNSNNSVRVTDKFMKAVLNNSNWNLKARTTGKTVKQLKAKDIWDEIIKAAWSCADPGLQFHDTIQKWHMTPLAGAINGSNPCAEYLFLDDSACNLASVNLINFIRPTGEFDILGFTQTCRILFIAQEILINYAGYPTEKIKQMSRDFRPLGLGFTGLGAFIMRQGVAYDSELGRHWAGVLASLIGSTAYLTSCELAEVRGPFKNFKAHRTSIKKVIKAHSQAGQKLSKKLIKKSELASLANIANERWQVVSKKILKTGLRNAQATVMAPTGTIGLIMDADTTGVEPEFSLLKSKVLVGGGVLEMESSSVGPALERLKYSRTKIDQILLALRKQGHLENVSLLKPEHLPVFDCAQKPLTGSRFLSPISHVKIMEAIQPFVSGGISKTVNLPATATEKDISNVYREAWKRGIKAIAIYRDGSKGSQPLSASCGVAGACGN